jgi:putative membrane protein insertion efficiency factor
VTAVAVLLVRGYRRLLSPFLGATALGNPRCKYHPSCSAYALEAYREFGFVRGTVLAAWRLLRCNPWSHGGVDYARDQRIFPVGRRS